MDPVRKISQVTIAWTPDRDGFPAGFRGKARVFAGVHHSDESIALFAHHSGSSDERAHDPHLEVRQDLCREIALAMKQDGVNQRYVSNLKLSMGAGSRVYQFERDPDAVHHIMLRIEEYVSDNSEPAPVAKGAVPTCPKCEATIFERAPALRPLVCGHAVNGAYSYAAVPPSTQCTGCGNFWHESDLDTSTENFVGLRKKYVAAKQDRRSIA